MDEAWPSYTNVQGVHLLLSVPADLTKCYAFISISHFSTSDWLLVQ